MYHSPVTPCNALEGGGAAQAGDAPDLRRAVATPVRGQGVAFVGGVG